VGMAPIRDSSASETSLDCVERVWKLAAFRLAWRMVWKWKERIHERWP